ncbi:RHS repeat-associated core domain-containing protein [Phormidium tenue FACHB-886]|nr:RHS repeat-associated core domain-containing protein [Phormidium tenue FACHB-886]
MVEVIQGDQHRYFKYDSLGRLIRVRQPEQIPNDSLDLADAYNTSGKWTAAFVYDLMGNVKRATDANGTNIVNEYDKANRITKKCYTKQNITTTATECSQISSNDLDANTPTVEYFYDGKGLDQQQTPNYAKGKLTKVTSSVSETRYTNFDYLGRLTRMEQRTPFTGETISTAAPRVSEYEYDFAGALIKETYPSGRVVRNEFEADGDLSRIYGKANPNAIERTYANGFSYTPDGKIQRLRLGNGRWESAKFNERLQVTEMALGASDGDGSLWKLKYEYGEFENGDVNTAKNTGNIARQTISFNGLPNPLVQTFKYDSLYRLKEARETEGTGTSAPQVWKETFDYDRFGNRTGRAKITGETTSLALTQINNPTIDPNTNRFADTQVYDYDKNGNLTQYQAGQNIVRTVTFDGNNKQKYVVENNQGVGEYFYDGEGKRVKKKVYESDGITIREETIFVYSGGKLVEEYSSTTEPAPTNPTTKWTATDQLGSPRVITDSLGNVISRRDFLPFGEEITNNIGERQSLSLKYNVADGVRQKFTGYQKDDETGLDFAEARMYENRHGRFTAVDPLLASGKSANPQTFNRYVYVRNNPVLLTDPSGLCPDCDNPVDEPGTIFGGWARAYEYFKRTIGWGNESVTVREQSAPSELYTQQGKDFLDNYRNTEVENFQSRKRGNTILGTVTPGTSASSWAPYGTPEQAKRIEEVLSYEPTGTFNLLNTSYKNSIGQASNGELAGAYLGFGANLIPGGQGGKQGGKAVVLGLETLVKNSETRFVLRELAEETGGSMAKNWAIDGITRRTVTNNFGRAFNQAVERADTIFFALDGLIDDIPGALDKGRRFGFSVERRNVTNAELYTIFSNQNLFNKTQFYLNNRPVQSPVNPFRFGQ